MRPAHGAGGDSGVDGVDVVLDQPRRRQAASCQLAVDDRLESEGDPAQRADPCIQSFLIYAEVI